MKTLILSCNTGEGHNSVARAIKEYYDGMGEACDIEDSLRFVSPKVSRLISKWHVRIYRYTPKLFDKGYNLLEDHPSLSGDRSAIHKLFATGSGKLTRFITENGYDSVICTHVISSTILTEAQRRYGLRLASTSLMITDYTCHPMAGDSGLDICFIPVSEIIDEFVEKGVPRDRIVVSGIPVRRAFFNKTDRAEAREKFGIPADCRHLLVMCGSMGCGSVRALVHKAAELLTEDGYMTVICGTNKKLYNELVSAYGARGNIRVLGFTREVDALMDTADLYLTKPGGISTTEAAAKHLPMVFVNAVAGCEDGNLRFFVEHGGAVTDNDIDALAKRCVSLLSDEEALRKMSDNLRRLGLSDGAKIIHDKMCESAEVCV